MKKIHLLVLVQLLSSFSFSQTELWGLTFSGGQGFGTIFKTDGNGNNFQMMYDFDPCVSLRHPYYSQLCKANNGKLYGLSPQSAQSNGLLYEYDPATNVYAPLHYFLPFNAY